MITSVTATNYLGESVKITLADDEPKHGLLVKSISGLGPAKGNVNTTSMVTGDGSIYNSARLEERNIVLSFYFYGDIEKARNLTYKYFPVKKEVELLFETTYKTLGIIGYVESNQPDIFSKQESNQISIICPDPYFYDASVDAVQRTVFSGVESLFKFPFECPYKIRIDYLRDNNNDYILDSSGKRINGLIFDEGFDYIEFGDIQIHPVKTIEYDGDIEIGIVIKLHFIAEATNIEIFDLTSRKTLKINYSFISGDDVIINTKRGQKYIYLYRNSEAVNLLNSVGKDPEWFTLTKGENTFAYVAEEGIESIEMTIENEILYEGV